MHKHKCTPRLRFGGSFSSTPTSTSSSRARLPTQINYHEDTLETYHVQAMKAGQEALETAHQQAELEVVAVPAQVVHELVEE